MRLDRGQRRAGTEGDREQRVTPVEEVRRDRRQFAVFREGEGLQTLATREGVLRDGRDVLWNRETRDPGIGERREGNARQFALGTERRV